MAAFVSVGRTETKRSAISPRVVARIAGACYVLNIFTSLYGYFLGGGTRVGHDANLIAGAASLVVTLGLYELLKPVDARFALLAVFFSLEGIAHRGNDALFFFAFYCIAFGSLVYRSPYFPPVLGVLFALAGVGELLHVFADLLTPAFGRVVSPLGFALDGLGEIPVALWLLIAGIRRPVQARP